MSTFATCAARTRSNVRPTGVSGIVSCQRRGAIRVFVTALAKRSRIGEPGEYGVGQRDRRRILFIAERGGLVPAPPDISRRFNRALLASFRILFFLLCQPWCLHSLSRSLLKVAGDFHISNWSHNRHNYGYQDHCTQYLGLDC